MRLSTKGQYAVRAIVNLAYHAGDKPVALKDISLAEEISLSYLEQLFVKLRKGNIVTSVRGPGGGYKLARAAKDITVWDVISHVEETMNPVACLDSEVGCQRGDLCVTQNVWRGLAERIQNFLNSVTIEELSIEIGDLYDKHNNTGEDGKVAEFLNPTPAQN